MARSRDGCVVQSTALAGLVCAFITHWPETSAAVEWLSSESGVPAKTILNLTSKVSAPRNRTTELWIADALVWAMSCPQAFHDGTLEVMPNPRAERSVRELCCPGAASKLDGSL